MQQSSNISVYEYEYQPNVKQKVKMLEASMYTKEDEKFRTSKSSRARSISESSALSSSTTGGDEVPAVMDVEITHVSPVQSFDEDSMQKANGFSAKPIILRNGNAIVTDDEDEITTPKDVKSLLKKFTEGVSNTASNLRRKSAGFVDFRNNGKNQGVASNNNKESPLATSPPQSPDSSKTAVDKNLTIKAAPTKRASFGFGSIKPTPKIPDLIESTEATPKIEESSPQNGILSKPKRFWNRKTSVPVVDIKTLQNLTVNEINNNESIIESKGDENQNFKSEDSNELSPTSELSVVQRIAKYDEAIWSSKITESELGFTEINDVKKPTPKPRTENLSIKKKKETLTGSILVMGPQNSGKSSIVNYLVRQDILTVHKDKSTTCELVECTATIKSEGESDFINSLKIIDTPGFKSEERDASLISTLLGHMSDTEGLNKKFPTLLLVPVKYKKTGNYADYSEFVNFLKCISHFHDKLFKNGTFQNILFVLTHLPEEEAHINENVQFELSNLISKVTPMVEPFIAYHYPSSQPDRRPSLNPFEMESNLQAGNLSLIDGIRKLILDTSNDDIDGHAVLKSAFSLDYPKSIAECGVSKKLPLKGPEYPAVIKMQKLLHSVYLDVQIEPTEISTLLEIGWENIDPELRKKFQSSLLTLQQVFQNQKIKTFSDLPEDPLKVLEILNQIPFHNLAVTDLLTETIQLKVPSCFPALYVGQGYDVSKDVVTQVSPFQFSGHLKTSPVGLIPEEISCKLTEDREIVFKFFISYADYVLDRFNDLSIKYVTFPTNNPPQLSNQRSGYNVIKPNQEPTKSTIATALIEYRAFQLSLCTGEDVDFKPLFWETISALPDLDIRKPETIESWKEFFEYWGTHVVKSAYGGGSIQINFRGKMLTNIFKSLKQDSILPSDEYETNKVFQYITGDGLSYVITTDGSKSDFIQGYDVDTKFQGGDMKFQQMDLTKFSHEKVSEIREEWIQSLLLNPVILETNLALVPISFFVRAKSEGIATKMDLAFHHFYSNFMALQGKSSCSIL